MFGHVVSDRQPAFLYKTSYRADFIVGFPRFEILRALIVSDKPQSPSCPEGLGCGNPLIAANLQPGEVPVRSEVFKIEQSG